MCPNDTPSVKPDGTTDAATLAADYEQYRLDLEELPLPSYRAEELRSRIGVVREALAAEGVASAGQLQHLLRVVTEALADVRAAQVVAAPAEHSAANALPGFEETGRAYEITATERRTATNVLIELLFTVVETPTYADRRAGHADGDDSAATDDGVPAAEDTSAVEDTPADDATGSGSDHTDAERGASVGSHAGPE
ncbi:hypothetical protein [Halobaculum sp. MBLA0143]|uniref:hypothetical protein n=1 Tax=Halobaculum sp. MBLA0143 TaxID=3079933 RepID=UPI003525E5C2